MALDRITKVGGNSLEDPLNFTGGLNITGVATATSFVGDGSQLTGVSIERWICPTCRAAISCCGAP